MFVMFIGHDKQKNNGDWVKQTTRSSCCMGFWQRWYDEFWPAPWV